MTTRNTAHGALEIGGASTDSMGFCGSRPNVVDPAAAQRARELAKEIAADSNELDCAERLLLLGAGESGKSTVFKQVRILHSSGYSESELRHFRWIIWRNVLDAIKTLVAQTIALGIELQESNEELADQVQLWDTDNLNPEMAEVVAKLWGDPGVQECFDRRAEFQLGDNALYFLSDVRRVGAANYLPTVNDALRARVRTSGVVSIDYKIGQQAFVIYDVGGQRSERRKWLPLFDHVTAIVFVAALNDYDQVVPEDRSKNRMQESLDLFQQIVNSKHFVNADVILFLNKKDLFEEKIKIVDPKKWFPDYTGGCDYTEAEQYFLDAFRGRVEDKRKTVYSYTTCATDTKNVSVVLDSVKVMLVSKAMNSYGF